MTENEKIDQGDFYLRIRDLRNNKLYYFRGYVTGITENVNLLGIQSLILEDQKMFGHTLRQNVFSFNLRLANRTLEFTMMYKKINKLTSLIILDI